MPKKLSEIQKIDIVKSFTSGQTIDQLSEKYQITKATITRHLKKEVDLMTFKKILKNNRNKDMDSQNDNNKIKDIESNNNDSLLYTNENEENTFIEIAPLNYDIDNAVQKDLSSVSIHETDLPKVVFMIVDNKIELETKLLKEYPDWQFLSQNELNRKPIEIYFDIKIAKRFCKKEQKVIKIPNTNVFSIAARFLISRGISRIDCPDKLISL